jgi:hypothetical protein
MRNAWWKAPQGESLVMRMLYGMVVPASASERICPIKTALRDWLHRLDARGGLLGSALSDGLVARGFVHTDELALAMLAHLEHGGWIVREARGPSSCWLPGSKLDLVRFEAWVKADGPVDGWGLYPLEWGLAKGEQGRLDFDQEAA